MIFTASCGLSLSSLSLKLDFFGEFFTNISLLLDAAAPGLAATMDAKQDGDESCSFVMMLLSLLLVLESRAIYGVTIVFAWPSYIKDIKL
jgi:hypothetical protein